MVADNEIPFKDLGHCDLIVDALYKGGTRGNAADDPISKLVGSSNRGGFRYMGTAGKCVKLCILYSTLVDVDWPDTLDPETGTFVYYGDNKAPGHELHDTNRRGNRILRDAFNALHLGKRESIPPFFIFTRGPIGRDVFFRGLAVPGTKGLSSKDDLVSIWKTSGGQRFQNYRATLTVINEPKVTRAWINDIHAGVPESPNAPLSWLKWRHKGIYPALVAPKSTEYRTRLEQLPEVGLKKEIVETIIDYFKKHPQREYAFEQCAAEIAILMDNHITQCDLTRPWRDGGRDALGKFNIGSATNAIRVEFALEAKCKRLGSASGVRETSRLISRLRFRQFGIFVTTSYVHEQAYKEIIDDGHPVIILSGADIANILIRSDLGSVASVQAWLFSKFPYQ